ncbi:hypothetical protein WA026_014364 [Henosepilachna vigintioctopunctata]|uniref:J domain-containing protein n=1 Tax=Henosepilachna vigintioctopunctata TaxID=420089 RepID=A0AAW1UBL3_9CUCU
MNRYNLSTLRFSNQVLFISLITIFWCFVNVFGNEPDFYDLLAISRNANNQEIRKAFKKMALKMHPDKNVVSIFSIAFIPIIAVDDPAAHEKFLKITRAYEILKQPETRKHYDVHGDTGSDLNANNHYQSYSYYRDEFGIYDDDPIIITLSASDYEVNILDDSQAWE